MITNTISGPASVAITAILSVLVIVNIIGNSLVCAAIIKNRDMRTPTNYLLVNLAVADIIVALFITPQFILIPTSKHPGGLIGTVLCKLLTGGTFMWLAATTSAFTMVVIAFERYYAVLHPHSIKGKMTNSKLKFIVPTTWMSSVLLSAPTFFTKRFSEKDYFCTQHWPEQWMAKAHGLIWLLLGAAAPLITMGVLYSRVVYSLWIKRHGRTNGSQQGVVRVRKRVTKMVVTVSIIYGLCWTPEIVIFTSILFSSKFAFGGAADITSIVLVACNSTVNPIVYAYLNEQFRNKIKALLCDTGVVKNRVPVTRRPREELCSQPLKFSGNVQVLSSSV